MRACLIVAALCVALPVGAQGRAAERKEQRVLRVQEALQAGDTAAVAHFYLAGIVRRAGRLDEAVGELGQALRLRPDYADALAELGQCHLLRREYVQAEQVLARALALDADHYAANFNLLTLYTRRQDTRRAVQEQRFEAVKQRREEQAQDFLRAIEARPR